MSNSLSVNQETSIHQLFELQASQTPDAIAVIFGEQRLTYRELNEKANQLAWYLRDLGVKPEVLVGVCVDRSLEMIVALLGILKAGGAYIPIEPNYPQERLAFIFEDSQLTILLTHKNLFEKLPQTSLENIQMVCLDRDWSVITQYNKENCHSKVTPENLAYIIYTSGSTGKPKGVQIEHHSVVNLLDSLKQKPGITQQDTLVTIASFAFDMSVPDLYLPLIVGASLKLIERTVVSDGSQLAKILSDPSITFVQATPATWQLVLASGWQGNKHLKVLCGGEALSRSLAEKLLEKVGSLWHMYGPTETTVWSMVHKVESGTNIIPLGHPITNTQIYLLEKPARRKSDIPQLATAGVPTEIYIGGDGVARGYLNRPDLTDEKFVRNPFSDNPEARLYRTGDLARYLPDGNIEFMGRIDHQIKIRGFRVELGEIEETISQHSNVREVAVIAKEDAFGSKRLVAYVVPKKRELAQAKSTDESNVEQLQQWQTVWNVTYGSTFEAIESTFNFTGWNDSFTGLTMPAEEVREWVDCTVDRILSLRPQRVLEIGCGMGLLLHRIAPHCTQYVGRDLSAQAIHHLKQQLQNSDRDWSHVTLSPAAAHELEGLEPASFDTVVINSVIQYFPSIDYLLQVIEKVIPLVQPGGCIFIGDVRSLPLLEAFHTGVQLNLNHSSVSCEQLKQFIQQRSTQDKELVIHPDFFPALAGQIPQISQVQTLLKRGHSQNELIRFRSDVILHIENKEAYEISQPEILDWQQQNLSVFKICQLLQHKAPVALKVTNIPDARLFTEIKGKELLASSNHPATVGELRKALEQMSTEGWMHPEWFWSLSQELPYDVYIIWSELRTAGTYDVVLSLRSPATEAKVVVLPEPPIELKPWSAYANSPSQVNEKNNFVPQLRAYVKDKLPDYMIPSTFVVMENLPLTSNGKIDRRALPEPKKERPVLSKKYVAPSTPLEKQLAEIWSQVLGVEQIGIDDNFFELGGHSLLMTQLLVQIEEVLQIKLPIFYLFKEPTITGAIAGIEAVQSIDATTGVQETEIDWHSEIILDPTIVPEQPFVEPTTEPEHIFLTGATGFLGAFLLHELLQQTEANIYCLVRASSLEEGRQKLQNNLEKYLLLDGELNPRIIPTIGDLAQPLLGLTQAEFDELASKLDLIYHCGAFVNLVYPYGALKAANVLGTKEILRLASLGKVTPVHYISTIDVLKPLISPNRGVISENEHCDRPQDINEGYTQTKWVAEELVKAAQARGIPTCVYRPGMLTGHSQTGAFQKDDLMSRIIKGIIQMKSAPNLTFSVNMIPIDYASQAIVYLSRQQQSLNKAFHILNPQALPWNKLMSEICNFGYPMQLLSHDQWQAELLQLHGFQENVLFPMRSLFTEKSVNGMTYLESFLLSAQAFDCQNTLKGLAESSIACPIINTQLLDKYFSCFIQSGFLTPGVAIARAG